MCKLGIVVGAAPIGKEKEHLLELVNGENVYVVAADGGFEVLQNENIVPDEWVGDMDSISPGCLKMLDSVCFSKRDEMHIDDYRGIKITHVSPIKDYTDMEMGLEKIFEAGCDTAIIFGGIGGERIEHSLANIQLIYKYALMGKKVIIVADNRQMFAIHNNTMTFSVNERGYISVFSLSEIARNVCIKGLKYEFEGNLTNHNAIGVSNEFCGKESSISVEEGTLLIVK